MTAPRTLTEAEALTMTRTEIVDRVHDAMASWRAQPPRDDAERAAYDEMMRVFHASVDLHIGLSATADLLAGRPNDYWDQRPGGSPGCQTPASTR
jgi:hypothetical protein